MAEQFLSRKITSIRKRDGSIVPFDGAKIYNAILKAGQATGEYDGAEAQILTRSPSIRSVSAVLLPSSHEPANRRARGDASPWVGVPASSEAA